MGKLYVAPVIFYANEIYTTKFTIKGHLVEVNREFVFMFVRISKKRKLKSLTFIVMRKNLMVTVELKVTRSIIITTDFGTFRNASNITYFCALVIITFTPKAIQLVN